MSAPPPKYKHQLGANWFGLQADRKTWPWRRAPLTPEQKAQREKLLAEYLARRAT